MGDKPETICVEDGRSEQFGVVRLADIDSDAFRGLRPTYRCVYFALLPFVGRTTSQCWLKVARIEKITGLSKRTVYEALQSLETAGFITRGKRWFGRTRRVNLYTITSPP